MPATELSGGLDFQLMQALARHTFSKDDVSKARDLVENETINWDIFFGKCIKQKIAGLVYLNLNRWGLESNVTPAVRMAFRLLYCAHRERNRHILATMREVVTKLAAADVDIRPLKGSVLVPLVYSDEGSRILSDIDLFIRKNDTTRVIAIMHEMGFLQGTYCAETGTIEPLTREEYLIWKLKMFNLPGFMRISENPFVAVECVDFTFGLGFLDDRDLSNEMMSRRGVIAGIETLDPIDFYLHVCSHLFKEASNDAWVQLGLAVNLIKFCDVRELSLRLFGPDQQGAENRDILAQRITALAAHRSAYFAVHFAHQIYGDTLLAEILTCIGPPPNGQYEFMEDIYLQGEKTIGQRSQSVLDAIDSL